MSYRFKPFAQTGRIADYDVRDTQFAQMGKVFFCHVPAHDDEDVVASHCGGG